MLGLHLFVLNASTERDFEMAFSMLTQRRAGALLIATDPFLNSRIEQLVALAARHGLPAMHTRPERPFSGAIRTLRRHRRMTESAPNRTDFETARRL